MKKSKVVTGVLTAALAMSLVPTPAIADALEGAGQQLEAQATQVANETTEPASDPKVSEKPATIAITTIITAPDTISYTLKKADGTTYEGVAPIGTDANMDNFTDSYWDGSHWIFDIPLQVFETPEQYGLTVPAGFEGDYKLDPASSSATVKFMYVDNAWVPATGAGATLVFVEEAVPVAPAFDVADELNTYGTVKYDLIHTDGTWTTAPPSASPPTSRRSARPISMPTATGRWT